MDNYFISEVTAQYFHKKEEGFRFQSSKRVRNKNFTSVMIVTKGKMGIQLDQQSFVLKKNDVLCCRGYDFFMSWVIGKEAQSYEVQFLTDFPFLNDLAKKKFSLNTYLGHAFWQNEKQCKKLTQEKYTNAILTFLIELKENKVRYSEKKTDKKSKSNLMDVLTDKIALLIENDQSKNHSLTDIAEYLDVHPAYLTHKLKVATGYTAMGIYYKHKMNLAKNILQKGVSIADTAHQLGFSDPYHFSNKYLKVLGRRPSLDKA